MVGSPAAALRGRKERVLAHTETGQVLEGKVDPPLDRVAPDVMNFQCSSHRRLDGAIVITAHKDDLIFHANFNVFTADGAKFSALPAGQGQVSTNMFNDNTGGWAGFNEILILH